MAHSLSKQSVSDQSVWHSRTPCVDVRQILRRGMIESDRLVSSMVGATVGKGSLVFIQFRVVEATDIVEVIKSDQVGCFGDRFAGDDSPVSSGRALGLVPGSRDPMLLHPVRECLASR